MTQTYTSIKFDTPFGTRGISSNHTLEDDFFGDLEPRFCAPPEVLEYNLKKLRGMKVDQKPRNESQNDHYTGVASA